MSLIYRFWDAIDTAIGKANEITYDWCVARGVIITGDVFDKAIEHIQSASEGYIELHGGETTKVVDWFAEYYPGGLPSFARRCWAQDRREELQAAAMVAAWEREAKERVEEVKQLNSDEVDRTQEFKLEEWEAKVRQMASDHAWQPVGTDGDADENP